MIISVNPKPELSAFKELMARTDILLNEDSRRRPEYYVTRGGNPLEDDVKTALEESAKGTPFENTIEKVSGLKFPDIVAAKFYGVEVKSTNGNHWKSTGSSILEATRVSSVERIYMTFGKLGGDPIEFLSKPYEQCLSGIAVTHMPRYLIDMQLSEGATIFDKIGIPYDELRLMDNPISPVSEYYRSQLRPGETLWWAGDAPEAVPVPPTVVVWNNVPREIQAQYTTYALVNFPEVFGNDVHTKYDRYGLWLTTQKNVVDTHIRDQFSSKGKEPMRLSNGDIVRFPGIFRRIKENKEFFMYLMSRKNPQDPASAKTSKAQAKERLLAWCHCVASITPVEYDVAMDALKTLFLH